MAARLLSSIFIFSCHSAFDCGHAEPLTSRRRQPSPPPPPPTPPPPPKPPQCSPFGIVWSGEGLKSHANEGTLIATIKNADVAVACELCRNHTGCTAFVIQLAWGETKKDTQLWNGNLDGYACRDEEGCTSGWTGWDPAPTPAPAPPKPTPAPAPPPPKPTPKPTPPTQTWPSFSSLASLKASPWASYYHAIYGGLPTVFPVSTEDLWLIYDVVLVQSKVQAAPVHGTCPTANPPLGQRYTANNQYQPPVVSWLWHPYPYKLFPSSTWVEVLHEADPFGDEHFGAWFMYARGSGIYFDLGKTIAFKEHQDAYTHFGVKSGDFNEELSKAAAAQGYASIQFLAHIDHANYQCDTHNTGNAGLDYMGMEVLACKLVGTYACGAAAGAPAEIKAGWDASRACTCDNTKQFMNCQGIPFAALAPSTESVYHV